jgi:transcriptional regulator GlxA family with amidase domain
MRIGVLLYDGVDLLDAGGPYEVFLTAARLAARGGGDPPFEVVTVTVTGTPVTAYGGMGLVPQASVATAGPLDVLIVPGTIDVGGAVGDAALLAAVDRLAGASDVTASVCTGAFLLADVGLLDGRPWTTHWEDVDALAGTLGESGAVRGVRWVDAGEVVTGAGLSSGIAMALHLVDRLAGRDLAASTARQIDYEWQPDGSATAAAPSPSPA